MSDVDPLDAGACTPGETELCFLSQHGWILQMNEVIDIYEDNDLQSIDLDGETGLRLLQ